MRLCFAYFSFVFYYMNASNCLPWVITAGICLVYMHTFALSHTCMHIYTQTCLYIFLSTRLSNVPKHYWSHWNFILLHLIGPKLFCCITFLSSWRFLKWPLMISWITPTAWVHLFLVLQLHRCTCCLCALKHVWLWRTSALGTLWSHYHLTPLLSCLVSNMLYTYP